MSTNQENLLCRYHYDPLDRLVECTPVAQASIQRFYQSDRLATEIQGATQRSIFQQDDQLLAQQCLGNTALTILLATDNKRSVSHTVHAAKHHPFAYSPYGHCSFESGLLSLLGFNGERPDPVTGHYLLGNGYRAFNPVLMRFSSPDSLSPFDKGGLNAYAYCKGDPINSSDPTGHFRFPAIFKLKFWRSFFKTNKRASTAATKDNLIGIYTKKPDTSKSPITIQSHLQESRNASTLKPRHEGIEPGKNFHFPRDEIESSTRQKAAIKSKEFQIKELNKWIMFSLKNPDHTQPELTQEMIESFTVLLPATSERFNRYPINTASVRR